MRPCQLIVAVSVDERSLQKRLFEVTGCRDHGPGNKHSKGNARALFIIYILRNTHQKAMS